MTEKREFSHRLQLMPSAALEALQSLLLQAVPCTNRLLCSTLLFEAIGCEFILLLF